MRGWRATSIGITSVTGKTTRLIGGPFGDEVFLGRATRAETNAPGSKSLRARVDQTEAIRSVEPGVGVDVERPDDIPRSNVDRVRKGQRHTRNRVVVRVTHGEGEARAEPFVELV